MLVYTLDGYDVVSHQDRLWVDLGCPGFAGRERDSIRSRMNTLYAEDNWLIAWQVEGRIVDRAEAIGHYEDAYVAFFQEHPDVLDWLVSVARDVYDNDPGNVDSGEDYDVQESDSEHLQDIAVRRAVRRLGFQFMGSVLVQIRSKRSAGGHLNPGVVPFHRQEWIAPPVPGRYCWWGKGTIEDFYQSNKVMLVEQKAFFKVQDSLSPEP